MEVNENNTIKQDEEQTKIPLSPITAPKKRGQKKGQLNENTKVALEKGRKKLAEKWEGDRKRRDELTEKYAIKKANKLIKEKMMIKKNMGIDENDTEEEEPIKIIQPKKPKKKQTIVLDPKSDSEEEIIVRKTKQNEKPNKLPIITGPKIVFF